MSIAAHTRVVEALLGHLGATVPVGPLLEQSGTLLGLDHVARVLDRHGHPARVVRLTARELRNLALPTIAATDDGELFLVLETRRRHVLLERSTGQRERVHLHGLSRSWGGLAIERYAKASDAPRLHIVLAQLAAAHPRELTQLAFIAVLGWLFTWLAPSLAARVTDRALPEGAPHMLTALACGVFLIAAQQAWLTWLRQRVTRRIDVLLTRSSLVEMFKRLTRGSFHALAQRPLGSLLQVLGSTEVAASTIMSALVSPLFDAGAALVAWVVLVLYLPQLALLLALVFSVVIALAVWLDWRQSRLQGAEIEAAGVQQAVLYEMLSGVATIKCLGAEKQRVSDWIGRMLEERTLALRKERLGVWRETLLDGAHKLSTVACFGFAAWACMRHELSVGTFLLVSAMADSFAHSVRNVSQPALHLFTLRVRARRVDEVNAECRAQPIPVAQQAGADPDAIVLRDVWFRYGPHEPWILEGCDLRIPRGEHMQLVGASGSGKTTILRLIAGLYVPERGTVSVFGRNPARQRKHLAYLPQNAYLFEGSIMHNLEVLASAPRERILEAAVRTGLIEWVSSLPMGFDTVLPPGAPNISGGERQWIVLTAAVAANRELVLLDESMSQVDRLRRQSLRVSELFAGRTVVSVEHDD